MNHKYGNFSASQMSEAKERIRKKIFFLLLIVDPNERNKYEHINVLEAFEMELTEIGGLNSVLFEPPELVRVISLLESALNEYMNSEFNWKKYRKLILDAGNEIKNIKEV